MIDILYEDKYLLICKKPIGVLSQPDTGDGEDMLSLLKAYLKEKKEKDYIGLIHRLDRNVGGAMLFSKKEFITSKLSTAIQQRDHFTKEYLAVVHGCPEEQKGRYEDLLFKDSKLNKSFVVKRTRKGVKDASLEYEVLESITEGDKQLSLVRVLLHTGRTHQIRVQFSSRKMPLLGDGKYGSRDNRCDTALWSYHLGFLHPQNGEEINAYALPPEIYPWNLFQMSEIEH